MSTYPSQSPWSSAKKACLGLSILCIVLLGGAVSFFVLWLTSRGAPPTDCPKCPECSKCPSCSSCCPDPETPTILYNTPYTLKCEKGFLRFPTTSGAITISSRITVIELVNASDATQAGPVKLGDRVYVKSPETNKYALVSGGTLTTSGNTVYSPFSFRSIADASSTSALTPDTAYHWNNEDGVASKSPMGALGSNNNLIGPGATTPLTWTFEPV